MSTSQKHPENKHYQSSSQKNPPILLQFKLYTLQSTLPVHIVHHFSLVIFIDMYINTAEGLRQG